MLAAVGSGAAPATALGRLMQGGLKSITRKVEDVSDLLSDIALQEKISKAYQAAAHVKRRQALCRMLNPQLTRAMQTWFEEWDLVVQERERQRAWAPHFRFWALRFWARAQARALRFWAGEVAVNKRIHAASHLLLCSLVARQGSVDLCHLDSSMHAQWMRVSWGIRSWRRWHACHRRAELQAAWCSQHSHLVCLSRGWRAWHSAACHHRHLLHKLASMHNEVAGTATCESAVAEKATRAAAEKGATENPAENPAPPPAEKARDEARKEAAESPKGAPTPSQTSVLTVRQCVHGREECSECVRTLIAAVLPVAYADQYAAKCGEEGYTDPAHIFRLSGELLEA